MQAHLQVKNWTLRDQFNTAIVVVYIYFHAYIYLSLKHAVLGIHPSYQDCLPKLVSSCCQ